MRGSRPLWVNSAAIATGRAAAGLVRATTLVLIARQLPVAEFGQFALALAVVEVIRQLADFGIETVAVRAVARAEPGATGRLVGTALALKLGFAAIGYAVLLALLGAGYRDTGAAGVGLVLGLLVAATAVSGTAAVHFQARLRMARFVWTSVTGGVVALALVLALGGAGAAALGWLAGALVAGESVAAVLGMIALLRERVTMTFSATLARGLLASSWPVALAQALVVAYFRVDMMVLARVVDIGEVGLYGVVVRITEPVGLVPAAMAASAYGALAPLWGIRNAAATRLCRLVVVAAAVYGVVAAALLAGFGPAFLAWAVPRYAGAGPALRILAWSLVFMSANMVTTAALNSLGRHRLLAGIAGATLVFAVAANVLFIPSLGIRGASLATVLTEAWNCVLQTTALLSLLRRRPAVGVL